MSPGRAEIRQVTELCDLQLHFKTVWGKHTCTEQNHKSSQLVTVLPYVLKERTSTQPPTSPWLERAKHELSVGTSGNITTLTPKLHSPHTHLIISLGLLKVAVSLLFLLTITLPVPVTFPVPLPIPVPLPVPVTLSLTISLPFLIPWHLCSGGHIIPDVFKDTRSGKESTVTGCTREANTASL